MILFLPLSPKEEKMLSNYLNPIESFHSNRIEGNSYTLDETRTLLEYNSVPIGKTTKDTCEIVNLSKVINLMNHGSYELSESLIKEIHKLITWGTLDDLFDCGNYKRVRNWVGNVTTSSPHHVPVRMDKLLKWYDEYKDSMEVIELATRFVYRFLCIHPFVDGNGRVSRVLFNLIINKEGYANCIIFKEDRAEYYKSLNECHKDYVEPLLNFFYKKFNKNL